MLQLILIYIHVMAAIIAFGPTFTFPLIGGQIAKHPQGAHFGTELMELIETRLVVPVAVVMLVTGALMWWNGGFPITTVWLDIALLIYLLAMGISTGILVPNTRKLLALMSSPPPAGATGPPPEVARRVRTGQVGGMVLTVMLFVIAFLMIFKP